jgi:hypothetical protein
MALCTCACGEYGSAYGCGCEVAYKLQNCAGCDRHPRVERDAPEQLAINCLLRQHPGLLLRGLGLAHLSSAHMTPSGLATCEVFLTQLYVKLYSSMLSLLGS